MLTAKTVIARTGAEQDASVLGLLLSDLQGVGFNAYGPRVCRGSPPFCYKDPIYKDHSPP